MLQGVLDARDEQQGSRSSHSLPSNENEVLSLTLASAEPLAIRIEVGLERECLPHRHVFETLGPVFSTGK